MFCLKDIQLITIMNKNRNDEELQKQYSVSTGRERHPQNYLKVVVGHWKNSNPTRF